MLSDTLANECVAASACRSIKKKKIKKSFVLSDTLANECAAASACALFENVRVLSHDLTVPFSMIHFKKYECSHTI